MLDMRRINESFQYFHDKVSTYDKANWEIIVERKKESQNNDMNDTLDENKKYKNKNLIDIDLIRGSTFHKAKPSYNMTTVSLSAFLKILFYPAYYSWWILNVDVYVYLFFLCVYLSICTSICSYFGLDKEFRSNFHTILITTLAMIFIIGQLFIHMISTNMTKPSKSDKNKIINSLRTAKVSVISTSVVPLINGRFEVKRSESVNRSGPGNLAKRHDGLKTVCGVNKMELLSISSNKKSKNKEFNYYEKDDDTKDPPLHEQSSESSESTSSIFERENTKNNIDDHKINIDEPARKRSVSYDSTTLKIPLVESLKKFRLKTPLRQIITVTMFDEHGGHIHRIKMSLLELSTYIDGRVKNRIYGNIIGLFPIVCIILSTCLPFLHRLVIRAIESSKVTTNIESYSIFKLFIMEINSYSFSIIGFFMFNIMFIRLSTCTALFFLLASAVRSHEMKYAYAKCFSCLTSSRRAKRNRLPHFRLDKVNNIKAWLSMRSFLKKIGPVRSTELIVTFTFFLSVIFIVLGCYQCLGILTNNNITDSYIQETYDFFNWEAVFWGTFLTTFLFRYLSLGSKIKEKFDNYSELITEQINLYLKMEQHPEKRETLLIANSVLKLAAKLLKELEPKKKMTGFIVNSLMLNIMRVVFVSFASALISEVFGIRFKLWKIKA